MAQVKPKPEKRIDPNSPEAKEQVRIETDQKLSTQEKAEKKDLRDKQIAGDVAKMKLDKKEAADAAKEIEKRQKAERDEYLQKPLSVQERAEYESLEAQANSGHPVAPTSMKLLADYRARLRNNGVENPE